MAALFTFYNCSKNQGNYRFLLFNISKRLYGQPANLKTFSACEDTYSTNGPSFEIGSGQVSTGETLYDSIVSAIFSNFLQL